MVSPELRTLIHRAELGMVSPELGVPGTGMVSPELRNSNSNSPGGIGYGVPGTPNSNSPGGIGYGVPGTQAFLTQGHHTQFTGRNWVWCPRNSGMVSPELRNSNSNSPAIGYGVPGTPNSDSRAEWVCEIYRNSPGIVSRNSGTPAKLGMVPPEPRNPGRIGYGVPRNSGVPGTPELGGIGYGVPGTGAELLYGVPGIPEL